MPRSQSTPLLLGLAALLPAAARAQESGGIARNIAATVQPFADAVARFVLLAATVVGVTMDFNALVDFADAIYFLMAVPNVIGMYLLAPVVKREMESYFERLRRGEIRSGRVPPDQPVGSA